MIVLDKRLRDLRANLSILAEHCNADGGSNSKNLVHEFHLRTCNCIENTFALECDRCQPPQSTFCSFCKETCLGVADAASPLSMAETMVMLRLQARQWGASSILRTFQSSLPWKRWCLRFSVHKLSR